MTNAACWRFARSAGERDGMLLGIARELHRRKNGDWPAALDELVPHFFPQLPIDRINGGPLGYRVVDRKPVVYSLGRDADDDAGKLPATMRPEAGDWNSDRRRGYNVDRPYSADELATFPRYQPTATG
ncbi:MAG: hypothetical protein ACRCT8_05010 [Lacipirellulaceae bacterium]